jgi:hypothetical protein
MLTPDAGLTWTTRSFPVGPAAHSPETVFPGSLIVDPLDPEKIYFCIPSRIWDPDSSGNFRRNGPEWFDAYGVYRSADGGFTWEAINNGMPAGASVHSLSMDREDPSCLYAALNEGLETEPGGVYKTLDGGGLWSRLPVPSEIVSVNHVHFHTGSGMLLLSAGRSEGTLQEGGSWISRDGGVTFEKIFDFPNILQTSVSINNPEVITLVAGPSRVLDNLNAGAYLSRDSGFSWIRINRGLGMPLRIRSLVPDPDDRDVLWCSLAGSGWYRGTVKPGVVARATGASVYEGEEVTLDGSGSTGNRLGYKWTLPQGIVSGNTGGPVITFTAPEVEEEEIFDIQLTVWEGEKSDRTVVKLAIRPRVFTGQQPDLQPEVVVFPNPAGGWLRIRGLTESVLLELFDLNGRKVLVSKIYPDKEIDLSTLPPGLYIGSFLLDQEHRFFKLIRR